MSTPQLENGYTRIANELLDALCKEKLNGAEFNVLLFIIRQTYGYHKKERKMTIKYIASGTNALERTVKRALDKLIKNNIILSKSAYSTAPKIYSLNKSYKTWVSDKNDTNLVTKMSRQNCHQLSDKNDTNTSVKNVTTNKDRNIKKEIKKECVYTPTFENVVLFFAGRGFSEEQAKRFYDYNDALGWSVNGTKIKKWQVFAERWIEQEREKPQQSEHKTMFGKTIENKETIEWQ